MYNNPYERCCQAEGLHQPEAAPVESRRHASLRRVHGGHGAEEHTVLAAVARGTAGAGPPIRSGAVHARGGVDADSQSAAADCESASTPPRACTAPDRMGGPAPAVPRATAASTV